MLGYMTQGTNDLAQAAGSYDALLTEIGTKRRSFRCRCFAVLDGNKPGVFCPPAATG